MYFVLSKIIGFVVMPSNAIALLGLAGFAALAMRFRSTGIAVMVCCIALLALFGWSPAANWLMLSLSERFPIWQGTFEPDGIIVLGGAIDSEASAARDALETDSSAERLLAMLQLAHRFPKARIVYSGGSGNLVADSVAEAPIAARLIEGLGLANGRVMLEDKSRTTEENAAFTRRLISPKPGERWLLVTSAWHMPRSVGLFRKAGFDVEAYPVDFRTLGWRDGIRPFDRVSYGLGRADVAIHEWVGLIAARLAGRSDELLPGPRTP